MEHVVDAFRVRRYRGLKTPLSTGDLPEVRLKYTPNKSLGLWIFLAATLVVFIGYTVILLWQKESSFFSTIDQTLGPGILTGLATALLYYLLPILYIIGFMLWHRQRPT